MAKLVLEADNGDLMVFEIDDDVEITTETDFVVKPNTLTIPNSAIEKIYLVRDS